MTDPLPLIEWEANGRRVWHVACPAANGRCAPMSQTADTVTIEDGSALGGYECVGCGARVFAGVDARRFVVRRPWVSEARG